MRKTIKIFNLRIESLKMYYTIYHTFFNNIEKTSIVLLIF